MKKILKLIFLEEDDNEEIDWEMEQNIPEVIPDSVLLKKPHYGFDLKYSNYFEALQVTFFTSLLTFSGRTL